MLPARCVRRSVLTSKPVRREVRLAYQVLLRHFAINGERYYRRDGGVGRDCILHKRRWPTPCHQRSNSWGRAVIDDAFGRVVLSFEGGSVMWVRSLTVGHRLCKQFAHNVYAEWSKRLRSDSTQLLLLSY